MFSKERSTTLLLSIILTQTISHNEAFVPQHNTPHLLTNRNRNLQFPPVSSPKPTDTALKLGDFFNFGNSQQKSANKSKEEEKSPPPSEKPQQQDDASYDESDPVEKLFSFFFGQREESPMGMARFGPDRFPEQYPATKTSWADPVESDDKEMEVVRPFLKNTNLETRALQLAYDANRDGWNAAAFHRKLDKKGGGLVVCTTQSGLVCGGYNPKGWVGYGEARGSVAAFLFIVDGGYATETAPGIKLQKVGGGGMAQMDMPEAGPSFGADSLIIPLGRNQPKLARSKLGSYYERLPDDTNSLFGKDAAVLLKSLKVYVGLYEEGEFIPHTDAEPFALY